ncbi:MAG: riboflavin biosynthesis protein RibF [Chloroflexi bacterium]|nr:riboflavin biosynthesis protein RibF [Chloroflexota bacterium]
MELYPAIEALPTSLRFVATVGIFDGLHRGHAAVLRTTREAAEVENAESVAITFDPHPDVVLRGRTPLLVCDPRERLARMTAAGIGAVVLQPFDLQFAAQTAEQFVRRLARGRDLAGMVMSSESAFGRDRAGTVAVVRGLAGTMGFRLVDAPLSTVGGTRISSTAVRELLQAGRLTAAARLLGRPYAVIGEVVHGEKRGRELGYPTANLGYESPVALPPDGVYAVRVTWGGAGPLSPTRHADGVASLGVRPQFGEGERLLEVHLLDFDEQLYGERLRVAFVRRQRGQRRFSRVAGLVRQMDRDAARARRILTAASV